MGATPATTRYKDWNAWYANTVKVGVFMEKIAGPVAKILEKIGTGVVILLSVFGIKWAVGDTTFYIGLGFIALLAFFAVYLYLR